MNALKKIARDACVLCAAALLCSTVAFCIHTDFFRNIDSVLNMHEAANGRKVSLEKIKELEEKGKVLWVDARSEAAYAKEHIPGAVLLNEDRWEFFLESFFSSWDGETIIVYCSDEGCRTSEKVADRLTNELGVADVYILDGGFDRWKSSQK